MRIRQLTDDDTETMRRHFAEAFGEFDPPDPPVPMHRDGKNWWGVDIDGRLVATALDREYTSWFGGAQVPTAGIGGVAVAAEHRGRGLLRPLFEALLAHARERGALISTLFATAPGVYQSLGYATIGSLDDVRLPTAALRGGGSTPVRRATEADASAIRAVHERAVRRENGPLSRTGPLFTEAPTARISGITLAERDGEVVGYTSWDRGRGYGTEGELRVWDVVADDVDALHSLLTVLSSFAPVTPTTLIRASSIPAWQHAVGTAHPTPVSAAPYALSVLDPHALTLPCVPAGVSARLPFVLDSGAHTLVVEDGRAHLEAGNGAGRTMTASGLSLTFAGAQTSAALRSLGVVGGSADHDGLWDLITARGPVTVRDYF